MPTYEEIVNQLNNLDGVSKFFGRREIKELPRILWEDEVLEKLIQGSYQNRMGVLVATNKRLIFVDKGLIGGVRVEDFAYDKISSLQYQTGIIFGELTVFTSGNKAEIKQVQKDQVRAFADYVRARMTRVMTHASLPERSAQSASDDLLTQIEKLAKLKDAGTISDEEFVSLKAKLING